jgi:hypothetical protein
MMINMRELWLLNFLSFRLEVNGEINFRMKFFGFGYKELYLSLDLNVWLCFFWKKLVY